MLVGAFVFITGCGKSSAVPDGPNADGSSGDAPADAAPSTDAFPGGAPTDAAPATDAAPSPDPDPDPYPDPDNPWDPGTPLWCGTMFQTGDLLFDSGHGSTVATLVQEGTRLLSWGGGGWILWDTASRTRVVDSRALRGSIVGLAAGVLYVQNGSTVRLLDATNAQLLSTVTTASAWPVIGLASDGSYLWAASASDLSAWSSTTGAALFTLQGDFSNAKLFAAPGEIRVALGPAGSSVVQRIATADGSSTTTVPFDGAFRSWFVDGGRFLTTAGNAVRVYTPDAALEQLWAVPSTQGLTGQGNFVWSTASGPLNIYPIGSASIAYTTPFRALAVRGTTIATLLQGTLTIIDLGGSSLSPTPIAIPETVYGDALAIDDTGAWAVGGDGGIVWDSGHAFDPAGPQPLSCGAVSVAGSRSGPVAVSTAAGRIYELDLSSETHVLVGEAEYPGGARIELSSDGGLLAAEGRPLDDCDIDYGIPASIRVFTMPAGTLHTAWECVRRPEWPVPQPMFHLAAGSPTMVWDRAVYDLLPSVELAYAASTGWQGQVSPNGQGLATVNRLGFDPDRPGESVTYIYDGATLVATPPGLAVGWIDDARLLIQLTDGIAYTGTRIVDPLGAVLASPALPSMLSLGDNGRFIPVDATRIYIPRYNAIYSLVDGSQVWASNFDAAAGDIAGPYVVSASVSRAQVHIEAY